MQQHHHHRTLIFGHLYQPATAAVAGAAVTEVEAVVATPSPAPPPPPPVQVPKENDEEEEKDEEMKKTKKESDEEEDVEEMKTKKESDQEVEEEGDMKKEKKPIDHTTPIGGPDFKDQMRAAAVAMRLREPSAPTAIPLANALLVTDSQLSIEERQLLEQRNRELQSELDRERHLNNNVPTDESTVPSTLSKQQWIRIGVAVFLVIALAAVGAGVYCATTGRCRGGSVTPIVLAPPLPPSTTPGPTPVTTRPTADSVVILAYVNNVTMSNQTIRYPSNFTAEERAVQWLIDDDVGTTTLPSGELGLRQRYALATLWFQITTDDKHFGDADHNSTWANANVAECDWEGVFCDAAGRVEWIDLEQQDVRGRIPDDLALLSSALTSLGLWRNQMTGTIPSSLGTLTALVDLDLGDNQLVGTIPSSLATLTALSIIEIDGNRLSGTIPSFLGSFTALTWVDLAESMFTGFLPICAGGSKNTTTTTTTTTYELLVVDCNEVDCPCCTHCCPSSGWDGIQGWDSCDS